MPLDSHQELPMDFLSLQPEDQYLLARKIAKNKGLIRVFIHPFFATPYIKPYSQKIAKAWQRMAYNRKGVPIVVFEEQLSLEPAPWPSRYIGPLIYTVPTYHEDSTPKFTPREKDLRLYDESFPDQETTEKNWLLVNEKLKILGARRVIVGGVHLEIRTHDVSFYHEDPAWEAYYSQQRRKGEAVDYYFVGCVSSAIKWLAHEFEIIVSCLANPHSHSDMRTVGEPRH